MDREYINKSFEFLFDNPERKCERKICDIKRNITIPERFVTDNEHRFYVYGFYNPIWDGIFYIGKGTGSRIASNDRNQHIKSILQSGNVIRFKIYDNLTENQALEVEEKTKDYLKDIGEPLIDYEYVRRTQREGIERARKQGKYTGRKQTQIPSEIFKMEWARYKQREISKSQLAKALNISRPTLDKIIKEREYK